MSDLGQVELKEIAGYCMEIVGKVIKKRPIEENNL